MRERSYEEKINDINNYLKQKEKEVEDNKISNKYSEFLKFDDDFKNNNYTNKITDDNKIIVRNDNNKYKKNEVNNKKKKCNKLNIILLILLFLEPFFITLSVISFNTTYLVSKPFNYIMYSLSGISFIWIICLIFLVTNEAINIRPEQTIIS